MQLPPASSNTKLPDTQTNHVDLPVVQKTAAEVQLVFSRTKIEELVSSHFPKPAPEGRPNIVRPGQSTEQITTIRCDCGSPDVEGCMVKYRARTFFNADMYRSAVNSVRHTSICIALGTMQTMKDVSLRRMPVTDAFLRATPPTSPTPWERWRYVVALSSGVK